MDERGLTRKNALWSKGFPGPGQALLGNLPAYTFGEFAGCNLEDDVAIETVVEQQSSKFRKRQGAGAGREVLVAASARGVREVNVPHAITHHSVEVDDVPSGRGGVRGVEAKGGKLSEGRVFVTEVGLDLPAELLDAVHVLDRHFDAVTLVKLTDERPKLFNMIALPSKGRMDDDGASADLAR